MYLNINLFLFLITYSVNYIRTGDRYNKRELKHNIEKIIILDFIMIYGNYVLRISINEKQKNSISSRLLFGSYILVAIKIIIKSYY